jgi:hypothetical protein
MRPSPAGAVRVTASRDARRVSAQRDGGTDVTANTLFYPGVFNDVPGIRQTQKQFYLLILCTASVYLSRGDLDKRRAFRVHV